MKLKIDKIANAYYNVSAAIATLKAQQERLAEALIGAAHVGSRNPSVELLSPKHRVLVSYIRSCIVPTHKRSAHVKITRCDVRNEYIARNNKSVKICSKLTASALAKVVTITNENVNQEY